MCDSPPQIGTRGLAACIVSSTHAWLAQACIEFRLRSKLFRLRPVLTSKRVRSVVRPLRGVPVSDIFSLIN
jgi:hypothetical protein